MDTRTGEIYRSNNEEDLERKRQEMLKELGADHLVEVDESEMTEKQKKEMKVSLHDNRSILGKRRVRSRREKNRLKREGKEFIGKIFKMYKDDKCNLTFAVNTIMSLIGEK